MWSHPALRWCLCGGPDSAGNCADSAHLAQFLLRDSPGGAGQQELAGVDWVFNAWGGESGGLYKNWDLDDKAKLCTALGHDH